MKQSYMLCHQVAVPINSALATLKAAGAVLVPYDSSAFQELAVSAWPGATADSIDNLDAASDYESIEVLGRQERDLHPNELQIIQAVVQHMPQQLMVALMH